jgi:hypothetical protein
VAGLRDELEAESDGAAEVVGQLGIIAGPFVHNRVGVAGAGNMIWAGVN